MRVKTPWIKYYKHFMQRVVNSWKFIGEHRLSRLFDADVSNHHSCCSNKLLFNHQLLETTKNQRELCLKQVEKLKEFGKLREFFCLAFTLKSFIKNHPSDKFEELHKGFVKFIAIFYLNHFFHSQSNEIFGERERR